MTSASTKVARTTHAHAHARTHARTHARARAHTHTHHPHTHAHTRTHARERARTAPHTHTRTLARARMHAHTLSHTLPLAWTLTHSHTRSHTHAHPHPHTRTHTHSQTHRLCDGHRARARPHTCAVRRAPHIHGPALVAAGAPSRADGQYSLLPARYSQHPTPSTPYSQYPKANPITAFNFYTGCCTTAFELRVGRREQCRSRACSRVFERCADNPRRGA